MTGRAPRYGVALLLLVALACGAASAAADVVGYRTDGSGVYTDARPVVEWDTATGAHVRWQTPLGSWGYSQPIIVGDRLFVTREPHWLTCLDADTGALLWERSSDVFELFPKDVAPRLSEEWRTRWELTFVRIPRQAGVIADLNRQVANDPAVQPKLDDAQRTLAAMKAEDGRLWTSLAAAYPGFRGPMWGELSGYATATPVSDGTGVYVHFGTGVTAAYDLDGTRRWMVRCALDVQATSAASPLLVDGKLLLHEPKSRGNSGVRGGTYTLCALDVTTGKTLWETPRLATPDWGSGSPILMRLGDEKVVITMSGEAIRPSDGKILAKGIFGAKPASAAGPVAHGDVVYHSLEGDGAGGGAVARAARLVRVDADTVKVEPLWRAPLNADTERRDPAAPKWQHSGVFAPALCHDGKLYLIEEQRAYLWVLDAATGAVLDSRCILPEATADKRICIWAPMAIAGDHLYIVEQRCNRIHVLDLKPALAHRWTSAPMDSFESAPVFVGDRLYVRGKGAVWCLAN